MYFTSLQVVTIIIIIIGSSICQQINTATRPKCCSDSLSPWILKPQPWENILRQSTYQSIIRHLDFPGTLDGRLDRDQALWRQLQEAELLEDKNTPGNAAEDTETGIVKLIHQNDEKISFEFHKTDKSVFECSQIECYSKDKSLLALWQVRKAEHPYSLRINVKLSTATGEPIEDIYEYNGKYGLKKLNPDPLQHSTMKNQKNHRFSFPQNKKSVDRADFHFPNPKRGFGVERVNPPPFLYDSSVVATSKPGDGWIISPPQKTHPGVIVDTGARHPIQGAFFGTPSGPYISSEGPNGFHHVIHSLPSISPPQSLDPNQQLRGFLPHTGPVRAPSPYKTEYAYDPRYILYYNRHQNGDIYDTTPATRQFKPSTEFVRYSEVDPFYHPDHETHLHTTPTPIHHFQKITPSNPTFINEQNENVYTIKQHFPNSINEQVPTNLPPTSPTKPLFQIIVSNISSHISTTTVKSKPVNREQPKVQKIQNKPAARFQMNDKSKLVENNRNTTKSFGEKIKTKNQSNRNISTTNPIVVKSTPQRAENYKKERNKQKGEIKETVTTKNEYNIFTKSQNKKVNIDQLPQRSKNSSTKVNLGLDKTENKLIKHIRDSTTASYERATTTLDLDYETTTEYNEQEYFTNSDWETKTEDERNYSLSVLNTTEKPIIFSTVIPTENNKKQNTSTEAETESPVYDYYYSDETTESINDTVNTDITDSNDNDFFTSLADNFFTMETDADFSATTTTTESPQSQNIDGETQESKTHNTQYRLLTFPGDSVSIVANRISKTYSYRTAGGKEGTLKTKEQNIDRL